MSERRSETHDFISVDSFSQLPFVRPFRYRSSSSTSKNNNNIRLFGFDLPPDDPPSKDNASSDEDATAGRRSLSAHRESAQKFFECRYCRMSFPSSQVLGDHQNAHKREKQQAKHASHVLQSAMTAATHRRRHDSGTATGVRFTIHYPSLTSSRSNSSASGGPGSSSSSITSSMLPSGLWMVARRDSRTLPLPDMLAGGVESRRAMAAGRNGDLSAPNYSSLSAASQTQEEFSVSSGCSGFSVPKTR